MKKKYKSKVTRSNWEENFYNSENRTKGFKTKKVKVKNVTNTYLNKLADKLKEKSYKYFLKSKYWELVREKVIKRDSNKCRKCNSTYILQVHHKTYEHHFREHLHLKDLILLCKNCHEKEHNIIKT